MNVANGPQRIASLSTEAVDILYRLGVQDRLVGISGFTVYPAEARETKPKISGFKTGKLEKILSVQPDLVIGYSHIQSKLLTEVEQAGVRTVCFHHRTILGIHDMVRSLGDLVGKPTEAAQVMEHLEMTKRRVQDAAARLPFKPRVYFEEWHSPLTCGIQWVSELIELAGGVDVFADTAKMDPFGARAVTAEQILAARPQVVLGSWCGQRFDAEQVLARPGFAELDALIRDIPSSDILAPGPVAIERGLVAVLSAMADYCKVSLKELGFESQP
ncbi:MAG: ABC transporter substrate-binding protein [Aquabacterium sp.]